MTASLDLSGRTVLVTGAGGGLGRAVAATVAALGATVVVSDVHVDSVGSCVDELTAAGAVAHGLVADLSDVGAARSLAAAAAGLAGSIDGLAACAGAMQTKPMSELTAEDWTRSIDLNLNGVFHVVQGAANLMDATGGGSIVMVASVAARSGRPDAAHYSAAKTAVLSLTKSASMAYAPSVRVNAVCPGIFLTSMWERILEERDLKFGDGAGQAYLDQTLGSVPLGRTGQPAELGAVVAFLLSDLASYVTGQALNVDGGLEMN